MLNQDNEYVAAMAHRTHARVLRFSAAAAGGPGGTAADLWAEDLLLDAGLHPSFRLHTPWGTSPVRLGVRGEHNVGNALAAAAAGLVAGVPLEQVVHGLERAEVSPWRMDLQHAPDGLSVLNDSYNAGPASTRAALRALAALEAARRVAVLGTMAELGADGPEAHRDIVTLAASLGVRVVAVDAPDYGPGALHVADRQAALEVVRGDGGLGPGDAVLVKGSRVAGLEHLAADLLAG